MVNDNIENVVLLRVDRLEAGMVVGRDVHTATGTRLLSAGDVLSPEDIQRLLDWNQRTIHVKDPDVESSPDQQPPGFRQAS